MRLPYLPAVLGCLFLAGAVQGQTRAHMMAGMSGYTLTGDDHFDAEPIFRLAGGGGVSFGIGRGFAVRPEFRYTVQGGKLDGTVDGSVDGETVQIPVQATFELTYLEIPFLATFGFDLSNGGRVEFGAGPGVAFKLDTRWRFSAESGPEFDQGIDGAPARLSGWAMAADYMFPVRGEYMMLGLRGWLSRTEAGLEDSLPGGAALRSSGFSLSTGIVF